MTYRYYLVRRAIYEKAVSYTHLDVYKRQFLPCVQSISQKTMRRIKTENISAEKEATAHIAEALIFQI